MIIMNAGSSYFEHVENYYGSKACEQNACRNAEMPAELNTEKAQRIKNNLIEIGLVTENFMPSGLSSSEAAILANQIGTPGIQNQCGLSFGGFCVSAHQPWWEPPIF